MEAEIALIEEDYPHKHNKQTTTWLEEAVRPQ